MPDKLRISLAPVPYRSRRLVLLMVIAISATLPFGCTQVSMTEHPANKAKGQLYGGVRCQSGTQMMNGEVNYGVFANLTVLNVGQSGFVKVTVILSCSEGTWNRSEEMILCGGESRNLTYFFHEPTHNATNLQCRAEIQP